MSPGISAGAALDRAFDLVVAGSRVLIGGAFVAAVLGVRDGRIAAIVDVATGASMPAARRIDAGARAVLPGFLDLHVHFDNPGESITDDFAVGTGNSALGGHTFVGDHPFSTPLTTTGARYREKIDLAAAGARVDFGLWGAMTRPSIDEIPAQAAAGAAGFKAFLPENDMGYPAALAEDLRRGFRVAAASGGTVLVHAEDRAAILELDVRSRESGERAYAALASGRGPGIELAAVREVLRIAEETGGAVHFVHLSVPEAVDLVTAARANGLRATCEVAAHHLLLDASRFPELGWRALCAPPLREPALVDGLWARLRAGDIAAVVSDHCPYDPREKALADRDSFAGPFGVQGAREFAPLFLDEALRRGWSLAEAVAPLTSGPAELFRLAPEKGRIELGADADLVLLDTDADWVVSVDEQLGDWKWTPYAGWRSSIRVDGTVVRGTEVVRDGELVGAPDVGRFVPMRGWDA